MTDFLTLMGVSNTFVPPAGGGGGYTYINSAISGGNSNTTTTASVNMTGGTLITISVSRQYDGTLVAPTDSLGNTYTLGVDTGPDSTNSIQTAIWYCLSPSVNSSMTFSYNSTNTYPALTVQGFGGITPTGRDQHSGFVLGSTPQSTQQPGSITTTHANEVLIVAIQPYINTTSPTIDSGFTVTQFIAGVGSVNYASAGGYLLQTSTGTYNPTWSFTSTTFVSNAILSIY